MGGLFGGAKPIKGAILDTIYVFGKYKTYRKHVINDVFGVVGEFLEVLNKGRQAALAPAEGKVKLASALCA